MDENSAFEKYNEGRVHMDANRFAAAIALFRESAISLPHFKTLELMGECLVKAGRPLEAVAPLAAAVALNDGVRAAALLSEVFLVLDQPTDARRMAGVALHRDPNNKTAKAVLSALKERTVSAAS